MLRFSRHLRQRLLTENKFGQYWLYAVGEIVLVVIGILIALQVDNWNEIRKKEGQGAEFRAQLREGVLADMENIRRRIAFFEQAIQYGYQAQEHLAQPRANDPADQWQFVMQAFHVSQVWNFNQATSTYNEVQNPEMTGFLGSPRLLNALQRYYSEWPLQLSVLTGGTQAYRDFVRGVIPMELQIYLWDNCYTIDVLDVQSFKPCGVPPVPPELLGRVYNDIASDPFLERLLTRRLSTLYARNIVYQNILLEAEILIELLQSDDP